MILVVSELRGHRRERVRCGAFLEFVYLCFICMTSLRSLSEPQVNICGATKNCDHTDVIIGFSAVLIKADRSQEMDKA